MQSSKNIEKSSIGWTHSAFCGCCGLIKNIKTQQKSWPKFLSRRNSHNSKDKTLRTHRQGK